ncbi:hypothetical protein Q8A67_015981 [Cirrhinus molitorella]|uniref:Uncharacterized protein n=1 Tax=Cirrhinus molitorella TaxID=172907 RepID=A0AA88PFS8_9TELE|nr:hypothetical protein Q8A67_015981 [Cirrhinus molitorella]
MHFENPIRLQINDKQTDSEDKKDKTHSEVEITDGLTMMERVLTFGGVDQVSVKIGEELKLDVLKTHVNKVVHQNKISTKWMVVWKRRGWVNDDGLTVSDGNLNINMLTVNDAGIYRVLDFDDEILITVTVTESSRDSKGNHTDDDKTDSELFPVLNWIVETYAAVIGIRIQWLNLLLLFCFVISSGTLPVGTNTIPVAGEKGGNTSIVEETNDTMDNTDVVISNDTIYSVMCWIVIAGLHAMALVMYVVPCVKKHQWLSKERVKIILMNWPQCKEM